LLLLALFVVATLSANVLITVGPLNDVTKKPQIIFDPSVINAKFGDTLVFNFASVHHTVTSKDNSTSCTPNGIFGSGYPITTLPYQFTVPVSTNFFPKPGQYFYMCLPHCQFGMKATIKSLISKFTTCLKTTIAEDVPIPSGGWDVGSGDEIKVVILGTGAVGKSCFTIQFVQNRWVDEYDPTIEDNFRKQVSLDGKSFVFDILDTAGQEEWKAMRDQWIVGGHAFLIMYAADSQQSLSLVEGFYDNILRVKDSESGPIILVGNKSDLPSQSKRVTKEQGQALADKLGIHFFEASAKNHYNVDEAFFDLAKQVQPFIRKHKTKK